MYPMGRVPQHKYVATNTTTKVNEGPTFLHSITITETVTNTLIVYDNTAGSGTIVASMKNDIVEGTYVFDVMCKTGLTIVTGGSTKYTVSYIPMD